VIVVGPQRIHDPSYIQGPDLVEFAHDADLASAFVEEHTGEVHGVGSSSALRHLSHKALSIVRRIALVAGGVRPRDEVPRRMPDGRSSDFARSLYWGLRSGCLTLWNGTSDCQGNHEEG